jgi:hypothetical protein
VADEPSPSAREVGMSDEKKDIREDEDVEAHKFMTEEPGEDDSGKTKTKFKTKTATSDETDEDLGDRAKY